MTTIPTIMSAVSQNRRRLSPISVFAPSALALLVLAYGGAAYPADSSSPDAGSAKVKATEFKDYSYAEKAKLQEALKQEMDQTKIEIDKLAAKYDALSDSAKADAKKRMQDLKDQEGKISDYSDKVKDATEADWKDLTSKIDQGVASLKGSMREFGEWIDKQNSK